MTLPLLAQPRVARRSRQNPFAGLRAVLSLRGAPGGAPALHARIVQERLVALGYLQAVTGRYDRDTLDAVARFQARHDLPGDGVPDARTADELLNAV